jgi:hypothetical protein
MNIISHRGYWVTAMEKNRPEAFRRSFEAGFGTETDLRDRAGKLVIAHDMAGADDITLDDMLGLLACRKLPLALNIKADGLGAVLAERMRAGGHTQWFTFDMAVPDMLAQLNLGLPVYTRVSEYEQPPICYDRATGVWLDGFTEDWFKPQDIFTFLRDNKQVCIVSPELHGRDPAAIWQMLRTSTAAAHPSLMLCTDLPERAASFFGCAR